MQKLIIAEREVHAYVANTLSFKPHALFWLITFYVLQQKESTSQVPKVWHFKLSNCSTGKVLYLLFI